MFRPSWSLKVIPRPPRFQADGVRLVTEVETLGPLTYIIPRQPVIIAADASRISIVRVWRAAGRMLFELKRFIVGPRLGSLLTTQPTRETPHGTRKKTG